MPDVVYDAEGNCDCHSKCPTYPVYRDNPHIPECRFYHSKPTVGPKGGTGTPPKIHGFINFPDPKARNTTDAEKAVAKQKNDFRYLMHHALKLIDGMCGTFEMTTHSIIFRTPPTFNDVMERLKECYEDPSPYNISTLSQYLHAFTSAAKWV